LTGAQHTLQDWKASPMWKPIKALTSMEMLPGSLFSSHCSCQLTTGRYRRERELPYEKREKSHALPLPRYHREDCGPPDRTPNPRSTTRSASSAHPTNTTDPPTRPTPPPLPTSPTGTSRLNTRPTPMPSWTSTPCPSKSVDSGGKRGVHHRWI